MKLFVTGLQYFINLTHKDSTSIVNRKDMIMRTLWAEVDQNLDSKLDV